MENQASLVKPATPTPHHLMPLSEIDMLWLPIRNLRRLIFFNTNNPNKSISATLNLLTISLSRVLVDFYPVAGRLSTQSNKTFINCNDEGVEFIEVQTHYSLEQVQKTHPDLYTFLAPNMKKLHPSDSQTPLLSLKVTGFACGGFCIGTSFQHVLGDGNSFWQFINSWAEITRGLHTITRIPYHNRATFPCPDKSTTSRIFYRAMEAKKDDRKEAHIFRLITDDKKGRYEKEKFSRELVIPQQQLLEHPIELQRSKFYFVKEAIETLKQEAGTRSSFVALAAHSWRCIIKAREIEENKQVYFLLLADCRTRVNPPMPPNYFGNFLTMGVVTLSVKRLLDEKISFVAKLVEECVETCATHELAELTMGWGRSGRGMSDMFREFKGIDGVMVVGSHKFGVYECDFGWGMPVEVDAAEMNEPGSILLAPSPPSQPPNTVQITTCLPPHQMDILKLILPRVFSPITKDAYTK